VIDPTLLPHIKLTQEDFMARVAAMSTDELQELLPLIDAAANQIYRRATIIRAVLNLDYAS